MNIYLTDREMELVISACLQYIELMGEGEDTVDYTNYEISTGLGSALRKISRGRYGAIVFKKYKTVTKFPTFEQWKTEQKGAKDEKRK